MNPRQRENLDCVAGAPVLRTVDAAHFKEVYEALCSAYFAFAGAPDWMRRPSEYGDEIAQVEAAVQKYADLAKSLQTKTGS